MKESMLNLKEKQYIISISTFKLPAYSGMYTYFMTR